MSKQQLWEREGERIREREKSWSEYKLCCWQTWRYWFINNTGDNGNVDDGGDDDGDNDDDGGGDDDDGGDDDGGGEDDGDKSNSTNTKTTPIKITAIPAASLPSGRGSPASRRSAATKKPTEKNNDNEQ